jgi:hypothetical protein
LKYFNFIIIRVLNNEKKVKNLTDYLNEKVKILEELSENNKKLNNEKNILAIDYKIMDAISENNLS